jgi:1-acyl-sn-glycerol-3-phosphate acyltransferase
MISPAMANLIEHLPRGLVRFLSKTILDGYIKKYARIKITGMEKLKDIKRPIIFVCNHLSNSDALVLNKVFINEDITFVAGMKLTGNVMTRLGINMTKTIVIKPNNADKVAISNIVKTLKSGSNILFFPEGTRSRTASLIKPKNGVILIQRLTGASIIPIGIFGTEKLLPIDETDMTLERFHKAEVNINIGDQVFLPVKNEGEAKHEFEGRQMYCIMRGIAKLVPESYRGEYSDK